MTWLTLDVTRRADIDSAVEAAVTDKSRSATARAGALQRGRARYRPAWDDQAGLWNDSGRCNRSAGSANPRTSQPRWPFSLRTTRLGSPESRFRRGRNSERRSRLAHEHERHSLRPPWLLAKSRLGVLATIKSDGRPQLSPVTPVYDEEAGVIYVSMTEGRAKTANLRRDPRATLEVTSPDGGAWATAEGIATLTGPATDPHGPEVDALVHYYRIGAGEHPDWDEYRSVMVSDRRVLMTMTVDHVYGEKIR